jgi:hypothetical protein
MGEGAIRLLADWCNKAMRMGFGGLWCMNRGNTKEIHPFRFSA